MKKFYTIIAALLMSVSGVIAETITWESKSGWTQSSGGVGSYTWFGVHTPGDASTMYSLTAIQLMQQTGSDNYDNYLAIARVSATSTININDVVAISDNHLLASQSTASLETYNFSAGVNLLGGTTYYFVFLSSNEPTNGSYPVRKSRLSLNHTDYGTYTYGNSYSLTSSHWLYYKAVCESSSATGFCTGDNLGGTTNSGNTSWNNTWTSGTTPSFKISSNANNINKDNANIGGLDIRSGTAKSATYTISAPTGYIITGYKLFGEAITGTNTQTVTPAEGGSAVGFTGIGNSLCVSGLRKASTSFTLTGENSGLMLHGLQVSLTPYTSLTTLPTANDKAYVIASARATFNFADNATGMGVVTPVNTNYNAEAQQIALIYKNENYYLFSVNAGKYLTANNTLTSMPTDAEQVNITATGNASYPWFFSFKNVADKNINVTGTPSLTIDYWSTIDAGNSNAIIEVADFDATNALQMFNVRKVTYNLSYNGNNTFRTVGDVTVSLAGAASDFVPASFVAGGVTLTYSPETITDGTTEVNVTATWNDPFQISTDFASAKWYVVDMHSNENNYTWQYDATSSEIQTPVIAKDAYESITDANLWCFIGNPYDGFKIVNKSAGASKAIRKAEAGNTVSYMSDTDDHNLFKLFASTSSIGNSYCFKLDNDTHYLNKQNLKLQGWNRTDEGSSCRFFAPGTYHIAAMNSWNIDAPLGAVGTKSYITTENQLASLVVARDNIVSDPFSVVGYFNNLNTILNPIRDSETIALTDGYYRFVNAYTAWNSTHPTTYYNSTADRIEWSVASNTSDNVNSIFKVDAATPSIYSPNAQRYMSAINSTVSGSLADNAGTTVFTSLGSAQYNVVVGGGTMHTAGHNSGAGTSGNLTSWGGGYTNTADAWYIVKVDELTINLNQIGNDYYATSCLPFDYTLTGATAYTLALDEAQTTLQMTPINGVVPAGTPVVIKGSAATATATIASSASTSAPLTETSLTGIYVPTDVPAANNYFLGRNNGEPGFYKWGGSESLNLAANRAYLTISTGSSSNSNGFKLTFEDDDDVTAIESAINGQSLMVNGQSYYDLTGRKVANPQKGQIYIQNGKKVLF